MNRRQVLDVVILDRLGVKLVKFSKQSLAGFAGKKNKENLSKYLLYGAIVAVLMAIVGWMGRDIWLASTQWLLISAVLVLFGIYLKMS